MNHSSTRQASQEPAILIIGAGPAGLGAAWRLQELGHANWRLFEKSDHPGGLSASMVDPQGFTWDLGGHVLFSHYDYFDRLMEELLKEAWCSHQRESWVWIQNRFIPYPLQNNIWRLPQRDLERCLEGLEKVGHPFNPRPNPKNFEEWILNNFGRGLADLFMLPYNFKVWAYPPSAMDIGWMKERVSPVDLDRIRENIQQQRDDCGWGPNALFRFPLRGGTGAIWKALANRLPPEQLCFGNQVCKIDPGRQWLSTQSGQSYPYDYLISTMPLDHLLQGLDGFGGMREKLPQLRYSSTHVVGVGMEGQPPDSLLKKCWMYFPDPALPFYRVTVFSNYSPYHVPDPGCFWSLLCEVSESGVKPVEQGQIAGQVMGALRSIGFIDSSTPIASLWHLRLEHGYPTPFLGRDEVLLPIEADLRAHRIWSRGRFGGWKYEVSNQDHSLMQGVEAVEQILRGNPEETYFSPDKVNAARKS